MHSEKKIYLILYINNIKFIEFDKHILNEISYQITKYFQIMNLDQIHYYFNMKIKFDHQNQTIHLSQKIYIKQLLEQFSMQNCSSASILMQHNLQILNQSLKKYIEFIVNNYQSLIKNLQFLAIYIHLNIAFATSFLM